MSRAGDDAERSDAEKRRMTGTAESPLPIPSRIGPIFRT